MPRLFVFFLAVLLVATPAAAASGDSAVLEAQQAYAARKITQFERAARDVPPDHVLAPLVEYWQLMLTSRTDDARIADYLARYPGSRMAEALRADWLKSLGAREAWGAYLAEYPKLVRPDIAHQCYARRAEWAQGDRSHQREAAALWFTARDLPSACTPLFNALMTAGVIGEEDVWRRLRLAFEAGNVNVARVVANALPEERRPSSTLVDQAARDPARLLAGAALDPERRAHREIAIFALDQLARSASAPAVQALRRWAPRLTAAEARSAWAHLGTWASRRHEPEALAWFDQAGEAFATDFQREWWVRAALRTQKWTVAQRVIDSMGDAARNEPVWRYWRARALLAQGQRVAANAILAPLSREQSYYGQLAQEELGPVMAAPTVSIKVGGDDVAAVARQPGIARAIALRDLGLVGEANQEWNWATREFTDPQLLAAAELARRMEWYDRAIYTAERTRDLHDFELRFVAPYRELAHAAALENDIDEAWVFGLMRQESRFVNIARSHVGASGLMQIMPATARWIAQRLGIKRFDPDEMRDPARNIQFGAYYLKHMQNTLDGSPVLATAAYNAGPGRAQRWRDTQPLEAAIYIETIPFSETRDYVKKVMSNAMYYAMRFGQPSVLLKDRLGIVPPRPSAVSAPAAPDSALETEQTDD